MKSILLSILFTLPLHAETFKIEGTPLEFKSKDGLLIRGCEVMCQVLKTIEKHKNISLSAIRKGKEHTNNVGSDVCTLVYKADILEGTALSGKPVTFCFFRDNTMVEIGSLSRYLTDKKYVK